MTLLLMAISTFAESGTNQFLGAQSCASSSCHGGADTKSNQNLIWSQHDPHAKSFATLINARSDRIAESLNITNAAKNARCTVCHAPFAMVPPEFAATILDPAEGVSCESCHGMAKTWLRSHTRKDFSHADKVAGGMRELRSLYNRANACVACHQNVDADILAAGHPELIFELDGQSVSEHKHWQEQTNWSGAQTWLVGQAVALREISWQIDKQNGKDAWKAQSEDARWMGLASMFSALGQAVPGLECWIFLQHNRWGPGSSQSHADELARKGASLSWNSELTSACLKKLGNTSADFRRAGSQTVKARYAERLVLGLDRLLVAQKTKNKATNAALDRLFKLAQSLPDFDPNQFADALDDFAKTLK
ncbi:MAG: multiheme c-type cytochrome [Limisphaerales bacterium]